MKRAVIFLMMMLLLLAACENKTTGKRVDIPTKIENGITGKVTQEVATNTAVQNTQTGETGKTAAQALKEMQQMESVTAESGPKSGTFYPPVNTAATGKDALKEKTRALFTKPLDVPNVQADDEFGAKYHESDGDLKNLPDKYTDSGDD